MNWVRHGGSTTFEAKSSYRPTEAKVWVARLGFKRRATAVLKSNLIRSIEFSTAAARRLKRASFLHNNLNQKKQNLKKLYLKKFLHRLLDSTSALNSVNRKSVSNKNPLFRSSWITAMIFC